LHIAYGKPFKAFKKEHSIVKEMVRIFIAHSSRDEWLINPIASNLKLIPVEPYLAKVEDPTPYPLPQKLDNAIETSQAVFGFWTSNVANNQETRDVFNWEISAVEILPLITVAIVFFVTQIYLNYRLMEKNSHKTENDKN
jgi:hypothetical protein